jgi:hypothetical protein
MNVTVSPEGAPWPEALVPEGAPPGTIRKVAASKASPIVFVAAWNNDNYPGRTRLSRMDPAGATTKLNCTDLGAHAPGVFAWIPEAGRVIYQASEKGAPLLVVEGASGQVVARVTGLTGELPELLFTHATADTALAAIGDELLDVKSAMIVGRVPGLYPISSRRVLPAQELLVYSAQAAGPGMQFRKLITFDLKTRAVKEELELPAHPDANLGLSKIQAILPRPDGRLEVYVGTGVYYFDHDHVGER